MLEFPLCRGIFAHQVRYFTPLTPRIVPGAYRLVRVTLGTSPLGPLAESARLGVTARRSRARHFGQRVSWGSKAQRSLGEVSWTHRYVLQIGHLRYVPVIEAAGQLRSHAI